MRKQGVAPIGQFWPRNLDGGFGHPLSLVWSRDGRTTHCSYTQKLKKNGKNTKKPHQLPAIYNLAP